MLDSNIFDQIIDTPDLVDHLRSLTASGRPDIVVTHVQEDELARIQDTEKSRAIQQCRGDWSRRQSSCPVLHDLDKRASARS